MEPRKCTICGKTYTPTAYNQIRCAECSRARLMRCVVCGKIYTAQAYNRPGNRSRCPECLSSFRAALNTHAAHVQGDAAREKAFEAKSKAGHVNIRKALAVRQQHPLTASNSHEHAHAKIWLLIDPNGNTIETQNIRAFVADNPNMFPNAAAAIKGFYTISQSLRHRETVRHPQYSYKGWRLAAPPITPDDVIERREYREQKEHRHSLMRESEGKNNE